MTQPFKTLFLALFAILATASLQAQTNRYVATTGSDAGGCTDASDPCVTISYALEQAEVGDVIDIAVGAYTEPEGLEIDKTITIQGAGRNLPNATVIQTHAEPGESDFGVIEIFGGFVVSISDVIVRNGVDFWYGGIGCEGCALHLSNVTVTENETTDVNGAGVSIVDGSGTFTDVSFIDNNAYQSGGGMALVNSSATTRTPGCPVRPAPYRLRVAVEA